MSAKKIVLALLIVVVAVGGFVAGLQLLKQRQNLTEQASVPGGQAKVSISPATGNFNVGDTFQASVSFNTANIAINGVAVKLTYPFTGDNPEVSVAGIDINSTLLSTGDWNCPTKSATEQNGTVVIEIGCANTSASGFSSNSDTLLAKINFSVNKTPAQNPVVVRFDQADSMITSKSNGQDILLIPTSSGSYTIAGASAATSTPTPTSKFSPTPTKKVTSTPTPTTFVTTTVTATPTTSSVSASLSPSVTPTLPVSGVGFPTILGIGLGVFAIVGAMLLAL